MSLQYWQKLQDPRWQKKRLEVFQRDGFKCQTCEATDKQLHVHHSYYVSGREPWEYPLTAYITLCAKCHSDTRECAQYLQDWEVMKGYLDGLNSDDELQPFPEAVEHFAESNGITSWEAIRLVTWMLANEKIDHEDILAMQADRKALHEFLEKGTGSI